jgi:hypothetical protein
LFEQFKANIIFTFVIAVALISTSMAKDAPLTLVWPEDKPTVKFTFGKLQQMSSYGGQNTYVSDVVVENLTDKAIPSSTFTLYGYDKNHIRIVDGRVIVSDLDPQQQVKLHLQFNSSGVPVTFAISQKAAVKIIALRVISVPAGAKLKVDGQDAGVTPVMVKLAVGGHTLDLMKEGYASGSTPLEVTPDELPGGSITIELGGLSRDTVELRDGTVLLGDVLSMSITSVVLNVDGKEQTLDRNTVKKMMLVERQITQQPVTIQSPAPQPNQQQHLDMNFQY